MSVDNFPPSALVEHGRANTDDPLTLHSSSLSQLSKCIEAILTEQPITVDTKLGEVAYDGNQVFIMAENVLTLFWCLR